MIGGLGCSALIWIKCLNRVQYIQISQKVVKLMLPITGETGKCPGAGGATLPTF
jgi:hypothetical protein